MIKIEKYSLGMGDRFAHEAGAQLKAIRLAEKSGIHIIPVWNKSNREHEIIKSSPTDTRLVVDSAIKTNGWNNQYFVDADHINLGNVDRFIAASDFFTIDVADYIGIKTDSEAIKSFISRNSKYIGKLAIPGIDSPLEITKNDLQDIADKYVPATAEAGRIYRHIESKKGKGNFVTEVSMDETNTPQTPVEFLFILLLLSEEKVPVQTIAPRFIGQFYKGVDYVGDVSKFSIDFEKYLMIIDYSIREFGLPDNLKLSLHSGSDKFSIYPVMQKLLKKHNKGIHVKTAGTTWLEEVIGLAMAGGDALTLAKNIYIKALTRIDELCGPYKTVIQIDPGKLPSAEEVKSWSSEKYVNTLRHIPGQPDYNPNFRQLIHVGYKVAAEFGSEYTSALQKHSDVIGRQVTENLFDRHICRLFDIK
jgi:hypothetical protein